VHQPQRRPVGGGAAVGVGETIGQLASDEQRDVHREPALALSEQGQGATEIAPLHVLERQEVLVADPADLEHLGDVDVGQLDGDLRFIDEARDELRILGQVGQHLLDDRQLLEPGQAVLGQENLAHAAT